MGLFDYFRLLRRVNQLESGMTEEYEELLEAIEELDNRIGELQRSFAGHIGGEARWSNVRNGANVSLGTKDLSPIQAESISPISEQPKDEATRAFIKRYGRSPKDVAMEKIRKGEWK